MIKEKEISLTTFIPGNHNPQFTGGSCLQQGQGTG
jgi:hypothetical protein